MLQQRARLAARAISDRAEAMDWRGPDPYDGLWARWAAPLRGGRRRRQAIIQLHARSPVDVRRIYRRSHPRLSKGIALFASVEDRLARVGTDTGVSPGRHARLLHLLDMDRAAGPDAWGYPFDTQTRWSFYPANTPNLIATTYVAEALLEGGERYLDRARGAAQWALSALFSTRRRMFAYHPNATAEIHNANILGARLVHRALPEDAGAADTVRAAVERTLEAQQPDGSWPYGDGPGLEFIDSFHTGYVLDRLWSLRTVDRAVEDAVRRGAAYYATRFFGPHGEPRLWGDARRVVDAHAAGTALTALTPLVVGGLVDPALHARVTAYCLDRMLRAGRAICRRYGAVRTTVRYLRWCDGHLALGLADAGMPT
jgi:hypothetical protein